MKTMFRITAITAALTCVGAINISAQDEPPSPPSPPPVTVIHDVQSVAEGAVHKAQADVENQMRQVQTQLTKLKDRVFMARRGKADKSLVVRSSDMAPRVQSDLQEDMTIMTHILDKTVAERSSDDEAGRVAMGINVSFVPGESPTRSIYVDGYGALFFLNVNFPLLPPPVEKNVEKEEAPKDSAWEQAKQEVYGQPGGKSWNPGPQVEYNAAKVTGLTNAILDALKNASNVRSVRLDESITVCVIGAPSRVPMRLVSGGAFGHSTGSGGGGFAGSGDSEQTVWVSGGSNDDAAGNRTTLTIRAKKADCVAFANGHLTTEEFRRRAVITIYGDPVVKP